MNWNEYFEMLIDWKKLPAYRAEPRVDSLIGFYLKPLLSDYLKIEIEGIIPEFPLRLGTVHPSCEGKSYADRSYKVDFLAIGGNGKNYLIEFKTDNSSRREKQDDYLDKSQKLGTRSIIEGALAIAGVSSFTIKYGHLKQKMAKYGLIDQDYYYTGKNPVCDVIFVIPANNERKQNVIDFQDIANWFEMKQELDSFEKPFVSALRYWHKESLKELEEKINGSWNKQLNGN